MLPGATSVHLACKSCGSNFSASGPGWEAHSGGPHGDRLCNTSMHAERGRKQRCAVDLRNTTWSNVD